MLYGGIYISWRHENKSTQKAIEKVIEEQSKKSEPIKSSDPITAEEIIAFFDKNGCELYASTPSAKSYKSHDLKNNITVYLHFISKNKAFFSIYFDIEGVTQDLSTNERMMLKSYVSDIKNKSVIQQEFRKSLNS